MSDIENRLQQLERRVDLLFMAHTSHQYQPLTDAESQQVKEMQQRMGWKGYGILNEKMVLAEVLNKREELKRELERLENDYPQLKKE